MYILGLDIGGTKTAAVLGDDEGHILERDVFPTNAARGFEATFQELAARAEALRTQAAHDGREPRATSVSVGGPLDIERGIIYSPPNLPGWDSVPLKSLLEERLGLPCHV